MSRSRTIPPPTLRRFAAGALVVPLVALLGACGDDGTDNTTSTTAPTGGDEGATATTAACERVVVTKETDVPDDINDRTKPEVPPSEPVTELQIIDDVVGTGAEVQPGDTITAHYVGVSSATCQEFDASWDRGEPAQFPLDGVIQGWSQGLVGMKVGGRRTLVIPPELGYGDRSPTPDIAPGDTLTFTVDLVSIP